MRYLSCFCRSGLRTAKVVKVFLWYLFAGRRLHLQGAVICLLLMSNSVCADDSWTQLQEFYASSPKPVVIKEQASKATAPAQRVDTADDPWAIMQTYYVPFTEADEVAASHNPKRRQKVSSFLHQSLASHQAIINEAANLFDIPPAVIGAVIMVESSGNPDAKATTSSAKGLMQTIDATFAEARAGLKAKGISISNSPFNPRSSIMAGSWYLDRMFRQMERDRGSKFDRNDFAAWRKVAEYYYAGPNHGRKRAGVVIMYAGGKRVVVDKAGYAQKVMRWARVMG